MKQHVAKYTAQALGAAAAAIVVWLVGTVAHVTVPAEVAVAFGTVFSILAEKVA